MYLMSTRRAGRLLYFPGQRGSPESGDVFLVAGSSCATAVAARRRCECMEKVQYLFDLSKIVSEKGAQGGGLIHLGASGEELLGSAGSLDS